MNQTNSIKLDHFHTTKHLCRILKGPSDTCLSVNEVAVNVLPVPGCLAMQESYSNGTNGV